MPQENPSSLDGKLRSSSRHRRSCWRSLGFNQGNGLHEKDRMLKRDDQINQLHFAACLYCFFLCIHGPATLMMLLV